MLKILIFLFLEIKTTSGLPSNKTRNATKMKCSLISNYTCIYSCDKGYHIKQILSPNGTRKAICESNLVNCKYQESDPYNCWECFDGFFLVKNRKEGSFCIEYSKRINNIIYFFAFSFCLYITAIFILDIYKQVKSNRNKDRKSKLKGDFKMNEGKLEREKIRLESEQDELNYFDKKRDKFFQNFDLRLKNKRKKVKRRTIDFFNNDFNSRTIF